MLIFLTVSPKTIKGKISPSKILTKCTTSNFKPLNHSRREDVKFPHSELVLYNTSGTSNNLSNLSDQHEDTMIDAVFLKEIGNHTFIEHCGLTTVLFLIFYFEIQPIIILFPLISSSISMVLSYSRSDDKLDSVESKIIIVDYHELGEPQTIELCYEKYGGWSFLSIGAGPDTWNIDHLQLEHNSQK